MAHRGELTLTPTQYDPSRHLGFVVSTWLHSYRQSDTARTVHPATFTHMQRGVIGALLHERNLVPDIRTAADGTVIAWSLWEPRPSIDVAKNILHYLWVAQPIRRSGFASSILREHGADRATVVSHWSDNAQAAYLASPKIRQLFSTANSPLPRFCPTLTANPNAFVAM